MFRVVVEVPQTSSIKSERDAAEWVAEALGGEENYYQWERKVKPFTQVVKGLRNTGKLE
jgi:hypothetical protein